MILVAAEKAVTLDNDGEDDIGANDIEEEEDNAMMMRLVVLLWRMIPMQF